MVDSRTDGSCGRRPMTARSMTSTPTSATSVAAQTQVATPMCLTSADTMHARQPGRTVEPHAGGTRCARRSLPPSGPNPTTRGAGPARGTPAERLGGAVLTTPQRGNTPLLVLTIVPDEPENDPPRGVTFMAVDEFGHVASGRRCHLRVRHRRRPPMLEPGRAVAHAPQSTQQDVCVRHRDACPVR